MSEDEIKQSSSPIQNAVRKGDRGEPMMNGGAPTRKETLEMPQEEVDIMKV